MDDFKMPPSENTKTPKVYELEIKEANHYENENKIDAYKPIGFTGFTQSELEKYANDPFWKVIRCTLFILFWVGWILMFVAAILLVAFGPKCAVVEGPAWWRKQVSYQIFTPTFRDSNDDGVGDFNGIREKLHNLKKIGMRTIRVTPVIAVQKEDFIPYDVIDFASVDERFGTMDNLKSLIEETHELDMHFTMDLPISTTSVLHKWFKSAKTGGDYFDYYIWKKASDVNDDRNYIVETGNENAYLASDGKDPILNWANPAVQESMFKVAESFIDIGVDGFHMNRISHSVKYLSESQKTDALSMIGYFIGKLRNYGKDNNDTGISNREIVVSLPLSDFTKLQEFASPTSLNFTYIADDSVNKLKNESCKQGIAKCLHSKLNKSIERFSETEVPHAWQFTNYDVSRLSSRFDNATASLMTFVQLSLPGIIEIGYGQELNLEDSTGPANKFTGLMQWDSSDYAGFTAGSQKPFFSTTNNYKEQNFQVQYQASRSPLKTLRAIAKMHHYDENFAMAEIKLAPLNDNVILFGRFKQENDNAGTAYIIGANFGTTNVQINGKAILPDSYKEANAEIAVVTDNVDEYIPRDEIKSLDKISLGPKQGIIIKLKNDS